MFENNNTPASAATLTEAAEATTGMTSISFSHGSTPLENRQVGEIERLLRRGRANAIPAAELTRQAGLRSVRELQKQIAREANENGALILAAPDGSGYFLAQDRAELLAYKRSLRARALNTLRRLHAVQQALAVVDGQISIDSDGGSGE